MSRPFAVLSLLLAVAAEAAAIEDAVAIRQRVQLMDSVNAALDRQDCAAAVRALNTGLQQKLPVASLLAGAMYEEGVCLKQDWAKAEHHFRSAHAAGQRAALPRLVAGLAGPVGGRDRAAALWWALQGPLALPAPCQQPRPYLGEPEAFVQVLQDWEPGRLDACVHVAAVVASIAADVDYPGRALELGLAGTFLVDFVPATGELSARTERLETVQVPGLVSGDELRDRDARSVQRSFERRLQEVGRRALKVHPRPGGIDAAWRVHQTFVFTIHLQ